MKKYRKLMIILTLIVLFIFITTILVYYNYVSPVSNNKSLKEIEIKQGMTSYQIGSLLEDNKIIKNDKFFVIYLKINKINDIKAGTYQLSESMSLKSIVKSLREGNSYSKEEITITFKEGLNFRQLANVIAENTNNSYDSVLEVLKDKDYINTLIEDYWFITEDIKNENIYYPLEGYLFPDTYKFKSKDITIHEIFKKLLDQMGMVLNQYKEEIEKSNYSVHELLTLASIAEKEVSLSSDRSKVVSVFINRINKKMSLGSDITTRYAVKLDSNRPLYKSEYNSTSLYNTRNVNNLGLPPSPICTISKSSIEASIRPSDTDYIYFISNIKTKETFFYSINESNKFEQKKQELESVNNGY